jgi:hypothetical protein
MVNAAAGSRLIIVCGLQDSLGIWTYSWGQLISLTDPTVRRLRFRCGSQSLLRKAVTTIPSANRPSWRDAPTVRESPPFVQMFM